MNRLPKGIDIEFGEQVWAHTPTDLNKRKMSLQERSVAVTWLGLWPDTNQHMVAIYLGKVIRVRTATRRPEAERWSSNVIDFLQATPQKLDRQGEVEDLGVAFGVDDVDTSEVVHVALGVPSHESGPAAGRPRRPRISAQ